MNIQRCTAILILTFALLPEAAHAQPIDRQAALDFMVAAEHAFADLSKAKGMRTAFLANLGEDSLLFGPDLISGVALWKSRPESPAVLTWYPVFADLSLAGDLGYTTGPWEIRPNAEAKEPGAQGHFVTLWKKQHDGTWKVLFDQGARTPKPAAPIPVAIPAAKPAKVETSALPKLAAGQDVILLQADRAFSGVAETKGEAAAYLGVLAEDARFFRKDKAPVQGREAIRAALTEKPTLVSWAPAGAIVSSSNDLGYTFGLVKRKQGAEGAWEDSDNYLRIWKRQANGPWKLVVDVVDPRPKEAPKSTEKAKEPAGR